MSNPCESYESFMVPTLFAPWASRLLQSADLKPADRVLDLACGTGIVARRVASRPGAKGAVTGLDLNPQMLEVARAAALRERLEIEFREGSAERVPFADGSFDQVLCQFGLMFFGDRPKALAQIHRVLTRSGRVSLSVWQGFDRHPFYRTLHEVIQSRVGISALQDIFSLGDAEELRGLLRGAGFHDVSIESVSMTAEFPNPEGFLAGEIDVDTAAIPSLRRLDGEARQAIIAAISEEMRVPLRQITKGDHVAIEFHAHLASASR